MMNPLKSRRRNVVVKPLLGRPLADDVDGRQPGRRTCLAAMTAIILLGFAFGANGLNADILWLDEMFSLSNMGAFNPPYSPQDVVSSLSNYSPDHVPLYFVLGSQWARLAGWTQLPVTLSFLALRRAADRVPLPLRC